MVRRSKQQAIFFFTVSINDVQEKYFLKKLTSLILIFYNSDLSITNDLLFGSERLKDDKNNALLMSMIEFIQSMKRFQYPLFKS